MSSTERASAAARARFTLAVDPDGRLDAAERHRRADVCRRAYQRTASRQRQTAFEVASQA